MSFHHKAIFLHAPKTGGRAIRQALWQDFGFMRPPGLTDWHTGFIPTDTDNAVYGFGRYTGWFVFGVVRNPYARFVSWWSHMLLEKNNPLWAEQWRRAKHREDFDGFIRAFLANGPSNVFPPMTVTLKNANHILRQESLQIDFEKLPFVCGPYRLPIVGTTNHAPYMSYYSPETAELIQKHYASDFDAFGYNRNEL